MAISKIIIMRTASYISYQLRYICTIRRAGSYVAGREWKNDNAEVKAITFVIKPRSKFTTTVTGSSEKLRKSQNDMIDDLDFLKI